MRRGGGYRQPVCGGPVLYPAVPQCVRCRRGPGPGMPGRGRPGGGHGGGGPDPVQPSEGLCGLREQAGILEGAGGRGRRIQALLHYARGSEAGRGKERRSLCPEAGGAWPSDGGLRRPLRPGQTGSQRPDDLAPGAIGGLRLRGEPCFLHRGLSGLHPAESGHSGAPDVLEPFRYRGAQLR